MRWLLDEMLPPTSCRLLAGRGHDAVSVYDLQLAGAEDERVFARAIREKRLLVTENFADYSLLLEQRMTRGERCVPILFVRKTVVGRRGPLAGRLHEWAEDHPDPYVGPHWV